MNRFGRGTGGGLAGGAARWTVSGALAMMVTLALLGSAATAADPTVAKALELSPVQAGSVDYDTPTAAEIEKCTLKAEKSGKVSGWTVVGPGGQTLRRFLDTNGNGTLDLWCYYKDGIEVYRDIDGDFNGRADQYRWLHTAGSRWGLDKNEDSVIDQWKTISAEEVTQEAVAALGQGDARRFARLLLTADELDSLGLGTEKQQEVAAKLKAAAADFKSLATQQQTVTAKSNWAHFGGSKPGLVPAGTDGATKDVTVYENVVSMVETGGKHEQVCIGTLVQVGSVWRLIDAPQVLAGKDVARAGVFFRAPQPAALATADGTPNNSLDEETRKVVAEIEKLEKALAQAADTKETAKIHGQRTELLLSLIERAKESPERAAWIRQLADSVSVAVQSGAYPEGLDRLKELQDAVVKKNDNPETIAYVVFRNILAQYGASLQEENANYGKIQEAYIANLKKFVGDYPAATDAADAMLQLATAEEFGGKEDEAQGWYGKIIDGFPKTTAAKKAAGAQRRLTSVGKPLTLKGRTYDDKALDLSAYAGRVVLVHYWATWSEPCKADLAQLKQLHTKYAAQGLSIISVSCDYRQDTLAAFLKQNPLPWPQLYEAGALDNRLAMEMGILTLPTMMLVDRQGNVASRNIHVSELDKALAQQLPARTAQPKAKRRE